MDLNISSKSEVPKYQQLVDAIGHAIAKNTLSVGMRLPSVNELSKKENLSRDTIVKAYELLKEQGMIDSVPAKGYFVSGNTKKVLLFLDTLKAYKEVLYHAFVGNLPENFIVEVQFHHYHVENFKNIVESSLGKYYKYVIMPFDDPKVTAALKKLPEERLLLIDSGNYPNAQNHRIYQDFAQSFNDCLEKALQPLKKYQKLCFVYPKHTHHPKISLSIFEKFAVDNDFEHQIIYDIKDFKPSKNTAYISVSDQFLGILLEEAKKQNLDIGKDIGILSYNETPMKKFIYKGISVISTDFKKMGEKGAEFVCGSQDMSFKDLENQKLNLKIPTQLILRDSL
ncbi:MAG: GntR family transcriptional regulator [Flavobacteriaceae bacterium]|nr:MAG: GntR family transcriptional regulator [Flavobacteriaceae bacterium]